MIYSTTELQATYKNSRALRKRDYSGISAIPSRELCGRTYFFVFEGALRQCKIKSIYYSPFADCNFHGFGEKQQRCDKEYCVEMDIAGIGTRYVFDSSNDYLKFYERAEDYRGDNDLAPMMSKSSIDINSIYSVFVSSRGTICRLFWNGLNIEQREIDVQVPVFVKITKDKIEIVGDWNPDDLEGYATAKECESANTLNVCRFEEEEVQPEIKTERVYRFEVEVKESDVEKLKDFVRVVK